MFLSTKKGLEYISMVEQFSSEMYIQKFPTTETERRAREYLQFPSIVNLSPPPQHWLH